MGLLRLIEQMKIISGYRWRRPPRNIVGSIVYLIILGKI
jgi:hypothetical protein